ncbi:hypothetical protein [Sphingomicrobium nitratireducens]|uniref:hypothetical protein n=1 Tax=Sphingomicrobium nitratireducens TaxID=2964666 RepID=UPI00223F97D2|nr:hypothetical protein [Sphingomicrobium nitratireducens]
MARYEKELKAAGPAPIDLVEWIEGLARNDRTVAPDSHGAAVARFLSGEDRGDALKGTFGGSRLTTPKEK